MPSKLLSTIEQTFCNHKHALNWLAHILLYGEYQHCGNHIVLNTRVKGFNTLLRSKTIR